MIYDILICYEENVFNNSYLIKEKLFHRSIKGLNICLCRIYDRF